MNLRPDKAPLNRDALRQMSSNLSQALNSSSHARSNFEALGNKGNWSGFDGMLSSLSEASRDTVELNSSQHGDSVLQSMSGLESLQREMGQLANSGSSSHGGTIEQFRRALDTANQSGVPDDVRDEIARALSSAEGGDSSVDGARYHVDSASDSSTDISYGAREVAQDRTPGEWEYGADVSTYADSADRGVDRTRVHMGDASSEANSAAATHGTVGFETERALSTVNAYLGQPDPPKATPEQGLAETSDSGINEAPEVDHSTPSSGESSYPANIPTTPAQMLAAQRIMAPTFMAMQQLAMQTGIPLPAQFSPSMNPWGGQMWGQAPVMPGLVPQQGRWAQPFPPIRPSMFPNPRQYW